MVLKRMGCREGKGREGKGREGKAFLDMAYDALKTRTIIIKKLKAIPYIPLNVKNGKGKTGEEKHRRRKKLVMKFYMKNFIRSYWVDPDDEAFHEFHARTFSEQGFSIRGGSLRLDALKHRGIEWATLHSHGMHSHAGRSKDGSISR